MVAQLVGSATTLARSDEHYRQPATMPSVVALGDPQLTGLLGTRWAG
ncbi:hypothetical protein ACL02S_15115 [Nocardia sp. 004]